MSATVEKPFTGQLRIQDRTGDLKVTWDKNSPDEVAAARKQFDDLKAKGYVAWSVKQGGEKNEIIKRFDADAQMVILTKPVVGG